MSVYKEMLWVAEQVEKQSIRIYPDACDYGVPIFSDEDKVVKMIKGMIIDMYGGEVKTEKYLTGATQTITCTGFDEWNTHKEFQMIFKYVHISKKYRKGNMKGYIYVEKNGYKDLFRNPKRLDIFSKS